MKKAESVFAWTYSFHSNPTVFHEVTDAYTFHHPLLNTFDYVALFNHCIKHDICHSLELYINGALTLSVKKE